MTLGEHARAAGQGLKAIGLSLALLAAPHAALAAAGPQALAPGAPAPAASVAAAAPAAADPALKDRAVRAVDVAGVPASTTVGDQKLPQQSGSYQRMKPTPGVGMPVDGAIGLQQQHSPLGEYARWFHNVVLMPIIVAITVLVLGLLMWVAVRYNRRSSPTASRTSHNTMIEVLWTLVPVLILVAIAVPSIDLLAKQYKPAPAKALTIKATGNQWFWTYTYPDNGGFEVTSYMLNLPGQPPINNGVREVGSDASDGPSHLEVDNRMVIPVGEPIRLQVTGSDVIHSFAVPSLWFKLDGVPGRINEKVLFVDKPGVYYGQCSELCGARHGYMPIAVEALPRKQFDAWVLAQSGGVIDGTKAAAAALVPATGTAPTATATGPGVAAPGAAAPRAPAPAAAAPGATPAAADPAVGKPSA